MFSFLVDFSRTVVVNVWALSGPFSPSCGLVFALFSVTNVLFSYHCSSCDVQVYDLCSTVVGYVQSCSYFSRDTIQLAPSIESNVPHQDVIVQVLRGYPSSP